MLFAPVLLLTGLPGTEAIPFLAVSTVVHVAYLAALVAAYSHGDFSLTYPMARGSGALLAAVGGVALLGDELGLAAWIAILVVVAGLMSLAGRHAETAEYGWALLTGLTIGAYSVVDAEGARRTAGVSYAITLMVLTAIGLSAWGLVRGRGPALVASMSGQWRRYLVAGACATLAYTLVLSAVRHAPVGYVAMLRESSIVIGAAVGWVVLDERLGARRVASSVLIAAGLGLLVLAR